MASFCSARVPSDSTPSHSQSLGILRYKDSRGKLGGSIKLVANQDLLIGRDRKRCHVVLEDPKVSNKHLRIYSIVYENGKSITVDPLVYAEDLSRNGTIWNGSLIGRGNGGFLLSNRDTLRVGTNSLFEYVDMVPDEKPGAFDLLQESEMKRFRKDYTITDCVLGEGAFGRVHMAIEHWQRTQVACKIIDLRKLRPKMKFGRFEKEKPALAENVDPRLQVVKVNALVQKQKEANRLKKTLELCYREVEILAELIHPNIVGLEKVYITDNTIYVFQDLITAGDLFSYIELKDGKLSHVEAAAITRQIVIALEFLHSKNIVHRDLKPDNVLMTTLATGCRVVLTDFGCARKIDNELARMCTVMGTYQYAAPEITYGPNANSEGEGYTKAVDMWSLGCITVVLLTGGYAFKDPSTHEYSEELARQCSLETLEASPEWQDIGARPKSFVQQLLVLDGDGRMSAKQALSHEWFTNDAHRSEFEELYKRCVKHWKPRITRQPVIEVLDAESLKSFPFVRDKGGDQNVSRRRGPTPVEPPYRPFPRKLNQAFFPKRRSVGGMSEEVRSAIDLHWTFPQKSEAPSTSEDELLPPPVGVKGAGIDARPSIVNHCEPRIGDKFASADDVLDAPTPRKVKFQPLRPRGLATASAEPKKSADGRPQGLDTWHVHKMSTSMQAKDRTQGRRSFSPSAWCETTASKQIDQKTKVSSSPAPESSEDKSRMFSTGSGNHPLTQSCKSAKSLHFGRPANPEIAEQGIEQDSGTRSTLKGSENYTTQDYKGSVDQENTSTVGSAGKYNEVLVPASSDQVEASISEMLDTSPSVGHVHMPLRTSNPHTANVGHKLKSPTRATPVKLKRRRGGSVYDFENDDEDESHANRKRPRLGHLTMRPVMAPTAFGPPQMRPDSLAMKSSQAKGGNRDDGKLDKLYLPRF